MTPPTTPGPATNQGKDAFEDLTDRLIGFVPKHLWVVIVAVMLMFAIGRLMVTTASTPPVEDQVAGIGGETLEGTVTELLPLPTPSDGEEGGAQPLQRARISITRGSQAGQSVDVDYGDRMILAEDSLLRVGDRVLLEYSAGGPYGDTYSVSDFVRLPGLLILAALFALATVAVGSWVGFRALISVGVNILAFAALIVPGILAGHDPILVAVTGSVLLVAASLYLIYQWRWKTHVAMISITISLLFAGGLAIVVAGLTRLTGLGTEDAAMLLGTVGPALNVRGLLLAGILVGAVGVLDDVAVGQASAAFELKAANPALDWRQVFRHSMVIGRDHIASMVNTLLLAYVGAALPLFLLLSTQRLPLAQTLNREFLAEEIVRTLVGSIALIAAVPITSLLAALVGERAARAASAKAGSEV